MDTFETNDTIWNDRIGIPLSRQSRRRRAAQRKREAERAKHDSGDVAEPQTPARGRHWRIVSSLSKVLFVILTGVATLWVWDWWTAPRLELESALGVQEDIGRVFGDSVEGVRTLWDYNGPCKAIELRFAAETTRVATPQHKLEVQFRILVRNRGEAAANDVVLILHYKDGGSDTTIVNHTPNVVLRRLKAESSGGGTADVVHIVSLPRRQFAVVTLRWPLDSAAHPQSWGGLPRGRTVTWVSATSRETGSFLRSNKLVVTNKILTEEAKLFSGHVQYSMETQVKPSVNDQQLAQAHFTLSVAPHSPLACGA